MKNRWLKFGRGKWSWPSTPDCVRKKKALHKPTSEGYKPAKKLCGDSCQRELILREALEIGRRCHNLSQFCFYNRNTFAAIRRIISQGIKLPPAKARSFHSMVGHYIAGTIGDDELNEALRDLEQSATEVALPVGDLALSGSENGFVTLVTLK